MKRYGAVLLVVASAVVPRLAALVALGERVVEPRRDQFIFFELAEGVASGRGLALDESRFRAKAAAWRAATLAEWVSEPEWAFGLVRVGERTSAYEPLYPYTLAAALTLGAAPPLAARLANLVFGVAAAAAAFAIGRRLFGRGAGVLAGLFVGLYPAFVYYGTLAMAEAAHGCLLLTFIAAYLCMEAREGDAAAAGVFGAAAGAFFLVRAIALPLFGIASVYYVFASRARERFAAVGLAVGVFIICITPWVIRNYEVHGELVVLPDRGGVNLWMRNNPRALALEKGELPGGNWETTWRGLNRTDLLEYPAFGDAGELARDRVLRNRMMTFIKANPGYFVKMCGWRLLTLVRPYGPGVTSYGARAAAALPYFAALALAAVGTISAFRRGNGAAAALMLSVFGFYLLYHGVIHGGVRYRLPADATLLILAANGVVAAVGGARRVLRRRKNGG